MVNILFNCTTNIVGGGVKNSAFFIKKAIDDKNFNWHFAVCKPVYDLLLEWELDVKINVVVFENSPARNVKARKELKQLVHTLNIDLVYTMAGPAYVKFPCKHLQGISNPYITHATYDSFRLRGNLLKTSKFYAHVGFQFLNSLKATHYVFQTQYARNSFQKRSKIKETRLFVIPNAFDLSLKQYFNEGLHINKNNNPSEITIFCPGAGYIHKGFQYIPQIARQLKKITDKKFKFVLTLPFDSKLWLDIESEIKAFDLTSCVVNNGPFKYTELTELLQASDIVFVPSLLETFSASYLEAMCAKKKLVVADKNFAREVCEDYATYISPTNSKSTAVAFSDLFENPNITKEEQKMADEILSKYGDQEQRFDKIITLINQLVSN